MSRLLKKSYLICSKCGDYFFNFKGGDCNKHKFCLRCIRAGSKCFCREIKSYSYDGNQPKNVQEKRQFNLFNKKDLPPKIKQNENPQNKRYNSSNMEQLEASQQLKEDNDQGAKVASDITEIIYKEPSEKENVDLQNEEEILGSKALILEPNKQQLEKQLKQMKIKSQQMEKRIIDQQKERQLQNKRHNHEISLLRAQIKAYKEGQAAQEHKSDQLSNNLQSAKRLIDSYYKMLILHFEQINKNCTYELCMEKIKAVKMLINNFEAISDGNIQLITLISTNKEIVEKYIESDIQIFNKEIKNMTVSFDFFSGNSGVQLKVILQKFKLYKEVMENQNIVQSFKEEIAGKINNFLRTTVQKDIKSNRDTANEFIIIEYFNEFLKFQEQFHDQSKQIYQKCKLTLMIIRSYLYENFKKVENTYISIGLANRQTAKTLYSNKEKIDLLMKMIASIRIIKKKEKYRNCFDRQMTGKIDVFKDQINLALIRIKQTLTKEVNKKDTANNFHKNYEYFRSLSEIKKFDNIWEDEENFYYNFKFTQLFEITKTRNEILKKERIHYIQQMVSQQRFDFDTLQKQIHGMIENEEIRSVLVCRIQQIFTKKSMKMRRLNIYSPIGIRQFDEFRQFYLDVFNLSKIISPIALFEGHIDIQQYNRIIKTNIAILSQFLVKRFNYYLLNLNQQQYELIKMEIKYYAKFEQFLQQNFKDNYIWLKQKIDQLLDELDMEVLQESFFKALEQVIQESKKFIQYIIESSQLCQEDYDRIKETRKAFTSKEEQQISDKIDQDIEKRIQILKNQNWQKGDFQSNQQKILRENIEKLTLNQQSKYKQKIQRLHAQAKEQIDKGLEQIRLKLIQQQNYLIQKLLPLILKEQENEKPYADKLLTLLKCHLNFLLEKQFKQTNKKQEFLGEYIYRHSSKGQKSKKLRQIFESLQVATYRLTLKQIPNYLANLHTQFQQKDFITKKAQHFAQQIDQLINLYLFFTKNKEKTFIKNNKKQGIKKSIEQSQNILKSYLDATIKQIMNIPIQKEPQQMELIMVSILQAKIYSNLLTKISAEKQLASQVLKIIDKFNIQLSSWVQIINDFSFAKVLSKNLQDSKIIENLSKINKIGEMISSIEQYVVRNASLISNRVISVVFAQTKFKDLKKNLQTVCKDYFISNVKQELRGLFNVKQTISQKCKMFVRVKNIVKLQKIKIFSFFDDPEYDIKEFLVKQCKQICQQTEQILKECNREYKQYIVGIKDKMLDKENQLKDKKEQIKKLYQNKIQVIDIQLLKIEGDLQQNQEEIAQKQSEKINLKRAMQKQIEEAQTKFKNIIDQLNGLYRNKIKNLFPKILDNMRVIQKISLEFADYLIRNNLKIHFDQILKEIDLSAQDIKDQLINYIFEQKQNCHLVGSIVSQNIMFEELRLQPFNQIVKHQNIDYVIKNCPQISSLSQPEKSIFAQDYERYKMEVQSIQKQFKDKKSQATFSQIVKRTIKEAKILQTPILLARIFGIQSILRIKNKQVLKFLRNPHPAQIIAILLLTQPSKDNVASLTNSMAQVKTGQGKSVVLAGLCCMLALRGFTVNCACYSAYLSQRDRKEYQLLFQTLGVSDQIKYGTFADHCRNLLNDERDKIFFKDVIGQCLMNNNQKIDAKYNSYLSKLKQIFQRKSSNKRILIIDQVDVFFEDRYFGQFYRPAISLDYECMKKLIKTVWSYRQEGKKSINRQKLKEKIKKQNCYQELIGSFRHLSGLFDNQLQGMIAAAASPQHTYEFQDQKIVYRFNGIKQQDLNYGLKTVFAACLERERNKVSQQFYVNTLKLSLIISQFSYAELPRYFDHILGVSGTLQTLPKSRLEIMAEKYCIKGFYILPTIFNKAQRTMHDPLVIQDNDETTLVNKILEESAKGRPVMVFFKSKRDMLNIYQSAIVQNSLEDCCFLTQDQGKQIRDSTIRLAGRKGRVTFMNSYFSRGTDFMIENKALIEAGGFHVIQTYLSKDESDYVQVYGRTARQGKNGSFQMIIKKECLVQFSIPSTTARSQIMQQIKKAWLARDNIEGLKLKDKIQKAAIVHMESYEVIKSLSKGTKPLIETIEKLNHVKVAALKNVRSIIVVDGTCSMTKVLTKLKEVIAEAIMNTQTIINNKQVKASFEQQIIIYRNYNSQDLILQCSGFSNNPIDLTNWIRHIEVNGGWGNEALEVAFKKLNSLQLIDQIIIIGDAVGNTEEQMVEKRNSVNPNQQYWADRNIPFVQQPELELEALICRNIPIHSLYVGTSTTLANYFGRISNSTNGICQEFHVNSPNASVVLSDFIAMSVLRQVGGQQLVNDYIKMRNG